MQPSPLRRTCLVQRALGAPPPDFFINVLLALDDVIIRREWDVSKGGGRSVGVARVYAVVFVLGCFPLCARVCVAPPLAHPLDRTLPRTPPQRRYGWRMEVRPGTKDMLKSLLEAGATVSFWSETSSAVRKRLPGGACHTVSRCGVGFNAHRAASSAVAHPTPSQFLSARVQVASETALKLSMDFGMALPVTQLHVSAIRIDFARPLVLLCMQERVLSSIAVGLRCNAACIVQ